MTLMDLKAAVSVIGEQGGGVNGGSLVKAVNVFLRLPRNLNDVVQANMLCGDIQWRRRVTVAGLVWPGTKGRGDDDLSAYRG
jgi:hypothetical protein